MTEKIDDFSNAGIFMNIRYWLIRKIAGRAVVMLNTKLSLVPYDGVHCGVASRVKGFYVENCHFPITDGMVVKIEQEPLEMVAP